MNASTAHTIHREHGHYGWDNALPPCLTVTPGESVTFECRDASAGFLPMPGGEKWEGRSLRRLSKLWLGHIAMTPDPAYESAQVLAVRHNGSDGLTDASVVGTPNLDVVRGWLLEDMARRLEMR